MDTTKNKIGVAYVPDTGNVHIDEHSESSVKFFGMNLKRLTKGLLAICIVLIIALITSLTYNIRNRRYDELSGSQQKAMKGSSISASSFGSLNGEEVRKYVIKNKNGFEVSLISFGAAVQSIKVKNRNGRLVNVVLGLNTIEEYRNRNLNPYFGSIVGRTSNRITNAEFTLNGVKYTLEKNDAQNNLHGGFSGFDMRNWQSKIENNSVVFHLYSKANEGGYPGNVDVEVVYTVPEDRNLLSIEYKATTSNDTPLDLTNHAYFNLNGHDSAVDIFNHEVKILADNYLGFNMNNLLVNGEIHTVANTKYDFRTYVRLGERIRKNSWPYEGYDNYFVNNQQSGRRYVASVRNPSNGIRLDIWSDQNGVQFYTGNYLNMTIPSTGIHYGMHNGFCLETHNYPDAVNKAKFPSSILKPDGEYKQTTEWLFTSES